MHHVLSCIPLDLSIRTNSVNPRMVGLGKHELMPLAVKFNMHNSCFWLSIVWSACDCFLAATLIYVAVLCYMHFRYPCYQRNAQLSGKLTWVTLDVYTSRHGSQLYTSRQGSQLYTSRHGSQLYTSRQGSQLYTSRHGSHLYISRHGSQLYTSRHGSQHLH